MREGISAFCKKHVDLVKSQIMPKFVPKLLKRISYWFLKSIAKLSKRMQDLPKLILYANGALDCNMLEYCTGFPSSDLVMVESCELIR
jgi:hypothetical protein